MKNKLFWDTLLQDIEIETQNPGCYASRRPDEPPFRYSAKIYQEAIDGDFVVVVPKNISLYKLAETVPLNSVSFAVLNDIYQMGYQYAPDYPDREKRETEDQNDEIGWYGFLMNRAGV